MTDTSAARASFNLRSCAAAAAAVILFGCAAPGSVVPQQATATEVRDRVGLPTDIRFDANGEELWEYATGPSGTETYLIRMSRDARVKEVTQIITVDRFAEVQVGKTTKAQIRDWLGRPSDLRYLRNGLVWEWRVNLRPELGHLAVRFDDADIVREKMVLTDPQTDDGKGDSQ
jgi:hypothetical protein